MEKVNLKKIKFLIYGLIIFIFLVILMFVIFIRHHQKIEKNVLEKKQYAISKIANNLKRSLNSELEYSIHTLQGISKGIDEENLFSKKNIKYIQDVEHKWNFLAIGIMDLNGDIIDNNGIKHNIDAEAIFKNLKKSGKYISDVFIDGNKKLNQLCVAVPVYDKKEMVGAFLGRYPISLIENNTGLLETSHLYFQIVDTNGEYIAKSKNKYVMEKSISVWTELKRYKFYNNITIEQILEDIKLKRSGSFYFTYKGNGRYVNYIPLDINNWYLFSILTQEKLFSDIKEIRNISNELLFYFTTFMVFLIGVISIISEKTLRIFKEQKSKLEVKNNLFKMLMYKMNNAVFEINFQENSLIFYNYLNEEFTYNLKILEPESLIKTGHIRGENIDKYKEIYKKLLGREEVNDCILEVRKNFDWEWVKVHSMVIDSNYTIGILEDCTDEKEKELEILKINEKIKYDYLTNLYTREACQNEIERVISNYKAGSGIAALFIIDLDNFKKVNDIFGHLTGDKILMEAAKNLRNIVRKTDILGRMGGDEFVLLLENISKIEDIKKIAEKINKALIKTYSKNNKDITISASIGITIIEENMTVRKVYKKADKALYRVKYNGRNSYYINNENY